MKILIIGGTGFIGGAAALLLRERGHDVMLGARKPAPPAAPMAEFPVLNGDYIEDGFPVETLRRFDAMIFAAGSDIRHVQPGFAEDEHWIRANARATPLLFARAREAGIRRAVLVGSFYPQAAPHLIAKTPYIAARHQADVAVRAMASPDFNVCSVNPPYVVGTIPGLFIPALAAYTSFALGRLPIPRTAPAGGANFISVTSVAQAIATAVERGEMGKAYLIGDENLSFRAYLEEYFAAVGDGRALPVGEQEHALFPDAILYAGRAGTIFYEPDPAEAAFLGYRRKDIRRTVAEIIAQYRPLLEAA
jgi:nucleoside-diphosphate-sugar epimerase